MRLRRGQDANLADILRDADYTDLNEDADYGDCTDLNEDADYADYADLHGTQIARIFTGRVPSRPSSARSASRHLHDPRNPRPVLSVIRVPSRWYGASRDRNL